MERVFKARTDGTVTSYKRLDDESLTMYNYQVKRRGHGPPYPSFLD